MIKSVLLLGILFSSILIMPFASAQQFEKATFQESASIIYDQKLSGSVITSIGFESEDIAKNLVFKSKFDRCGAIYCGDDFKALVESLGLEGLLFLEDLVGGF